MHIQLLYAWPKSQAIAADVWRNSRIADERTRGKRWKAILHALRLCTDATMHLANGKSERGREEGRPAQRRIAKVYYISRFTPLYSRFYAIDEPLSRHTIWRKLEQAAVRLPSRSISDRVIRAPRIRRFRLRRGSPREELFLNRVKSHVALMEFRCGNE